MELEVRLYNSMRKPGEPMSKRLKLDREITVGDLVERLGIVGEKIFVAFKNGKPLGRGLAAAAHEVVRNGDTLALSGPIPFSWATAHRSCSTRRRQVNGISRRNYCAGRGSSVKPVPP